ncbi:MAG: hypothetical protein QM765_21395 [Myxococcales bacterium]
MAVPGLSCAQGDGRARELERRDDGDAQRSGQAGQAAVGARLDAPHQLEGAGLGGDELGKLAAVGRVAQVDFLERSVDLGAQAELVAREEAGLGHAAGLAGHQREVDLQRAGDGGVILGLELQAQVEVLDGGDRGRQELLARLELPASGRRLGDVEEAVALAAHHIERPVLGGQRRAVGALEGELEVLGRDDDQVERGDELVDGEREVLRGLGHARAGVEGVDLGEEVRQVLGLLGDHRRPASPAPDLLQELSRRALGQADDLHLDAADGGERLREDEALAAALALFGGLLALLRLLVRLEVARLLGRGLALAVGEEDQEALLARGRRRGRGERLGRSVESGAEVGPLAVVADGADGVLEAVADGGAGDGLEPAGDVPGLGLELGDGDGVAVTGQVDVELRGHLAQLLRVRAPHARRGVDDDQRPEGLGGGLAGETQNERTTEPLAEPPHGRLQKSRKGAIFRGFAEGSQFSDLGLPRQFPREVPGLALVRDRGHKAGPQRSYGSTRYPALEDPYSPRIGGDLGRW